MELPLVCTTVFLLVLILQLLVVQSQVIPLKDEDYLDPEAVISEVDTWEAEDGLSYSLGQSRGSKSGGCIDRLGSRCTKYLKVGLCDRSPIVKTSYCRKTCKTCTGRRYRSHDDDPNGCKDKSPTESCKRFRARGICRMYADIKHVFCKKTCGACVPKRNEGYYDKKENDQESDYDKSQGDKDKDKTEKYEDESGNNNDNSNIDQDDSEDEGNRSINRKDENQNKDQNDNGEIDNGGSSDGLGIHMVECVDEAPQISCEEFARKGRCEEYDDVRNQYCRKTCGTCTENIVESNCFDRLPRSCKNYMNDGYCESDPVVKNSLCRKTCQTCTTNKDEKEISYCQNQVPDKACRRFAAERLCERYEGIRDVVCRKSCGTCF